MTRSRQRRENKQNAQACGCLVGIIVLLAGLGYNAIFGDDKPKPTASSSPTPTTPPDKHATTACANTRAANVLKVAGRTKRAAVYEKTAIRAASRSSVPKLREAAAKPERTALGVSFWCSVYLDDITDESVDRYLPSFRREHQKIRDAEAVRSGTGNGSGSRGGGRRGGRSGWRR